MAVMLIDIDHFKAINDSHGHAIGDKVLKEVAASIKDIARKGDTYCRMGGEEFLVICHNGSTDAKSVVLFAERLRQHIDSQDIHVDGLQIRTSISIGIALKEVAMKSEDHLINAADKALYAAKNSGRNKVCMAQGSQFVSCTANADC